LRLPEAANALSGCGLSSRVHGEGGLPAQPAPSSEAVLEEL